MAEINIEKMTQNVAEKVIAIVREDFIHKSVYENRLKADMAAMLEDLRLDIEELPSNHTFIDGLYDGGYRFGLKEVNELVQERIDTLRGEEK